MVGWKNSLVLPVSWLLLAGGVAVGFLSATGSFLQAADCTGPTVQTQHGQLCGVRAVAEDGFPYLAFRGVPYAKPPVGDLRFSAPHPVAPWTGVRKAVREGPMCLQSGQGEVIGSLSTTLRQGLLLFRALPRLISNVASGRQNEDCLYLNIYTRDVTGGHTRPVMIWVHGGGFHLGSGNADLYGPDYLLSDDVVLVTFNYRLGPLGFLSVPKGGVPGNAGLKDQVAVLRWVKDNIAAFGGDPNRITIFGESAGGTSVQMHLLSPLSRGLFSGAISQSGSALNPRSSVSAEVAHERSRRLGHRLGLQPRDDADLVHQLRALPAEKLIGMSENVLTPQERARGLAVHPFVPSVEPPGPGAFLDKSPGEYLAAGDIAEVPYITGVNSMEAGFLLNRNKRMQNNELDNELEQLVPSDLGLTPGSPESWQVAQQMKKEYFSDSTQPTDEELAKMYSDMFVVWVVQRSVNLHSRLSRAPLYVYLLSYDGEPAPSNRILDKKLPGVNHGDEMGYLFPMSTLPRRQENETDILTRKRLIKLWTNFAKTRDPNKESAPFLTTAWPTANNLSGNFLEINEDLVVRRGFLSPHMKLWNKIYPENRGGLRQ